MRDPLPQLCSLNDVLRTVALALAPQPHASIRRRYPDDMRQLLTGIREVSLELGMKIPTS